MVCVCVSRALQMVVFGDCDVFPGRRCTPEAPCEAGPATSCYALLDWRSPALVISLSLSFSPRFFFYKCRLVWSPKATFSSF